MMVPAASYLTGAFILAVIFALSHTGEEARETLRDEPGYVVFLILCVAFWPIAVLVIALHEKKGGST